jgi:hypothetical protein
MIANDRTARAMRRVVVLTVAAILTTTVSPVRVARAEPSSTDVALADALFADGRALMDRGKFAEACPKLAESHRLDPGGGVVLALALCREAEGKTASAWVAFEEALIFAKRDKRDDRKATIEQHLAQLRDVLSRFSVSLGDAARSQGAVVTLDGRALSDASLGVAFMVDPGEHQILATAPGKAAFRVSITIGRGEQKNVVVPALLPSSAGDRPVVGDTSYGTQRAIGWVSLSLGVVTLGVSGFYGLRAFSRERDSEARCPNDVCDVQGLGLHDQAKNAARVSTVAFVAGTLAVGLGIVLVLTAPTKTDRPKSAVAVRLAPSVGATHGLALSGSF